MEKKRRRRRKRSQNKTTEVAGKQQQQQQQQIYLVTSLDMRLFLQLYKITNFKEHRTKKLSGNNIKKEGIH